MFGKKFLFERKGMKTWIAKLKINIRTVAWLIRKTLRMVLCETRRCCCAMLHCSSTKVKIFFFLFAYAFSVRLNRNANKEKYARRWKKWSQILLRIDSEWLSYGRFFFYILLIDFCVVFACNLFLFRFLVRIKKLIDALMMMTLVEKDKNYWIYFNWKLFFFCFR